jgi:hypothetical protein
MSRNPLVGRFLFAKNPFARARISTSFQGPRNRFPALRVGTTTLLAGPPSSIGLRNRSSKSIPVLPKRLQIRPLEILYQAFRGFYFKQLQDFL